MKHIYVAAAIIEYDGKILCMQRGESKHSYTSFHYEFPGGKIEAGETAPQALMRELSEEMDLHIGISEADFYDEVSYVYPDFEITLRFYLCHVSSDEFNRKEHIDHKWMLPGELGVLDWAAADWSVVERLKRSRTMSVTIVKQGITFMDTDAVVNAANEGLRAGGGVCGVIFRDAGHDRLQEACSKIGGCRTGAAVITPGFGLKAKYIIHAVGPVWNGGGNGEPELLYSCYRSSLRLAEENGCDSVAFPLISAGIYGYPREGAWRIAIRACLDHKKDHPDSRTEIFFAVLDDSILELGKKILREELESESR